MNCRLVVASRHLGPDGCTSFQHGSPIDLVSLHASGRFWWCIEKRLHATGIALCTSCLARKRRQRVLADEEVTIDLMPDTVYNPHQ